MTAQDEVRGWLSARGTELPEPAWGRLEAYARDVLDYNRRTNLTAAKDLGELWRRHLADGLAALKPLQARLAGAPRLVDLGCGAGFVGVALKAAWPEAEVTLVESAYRKASFLVWATARLGLSGLRAVHGKAGGTSAVELLRARGGAAAGREPFAADAVLARALAPLPEALALARPLARAGGWAAVYQSERPSDAALEPEAYRLPGEAADRFLAFSRREG